MKKVSLGEIARAAGVSRVAVCRALLNKPGVSAATRLRIVRISQKLGYMPDARIGSWMARVRDAKSKDLVPIAWLNTAWEKDAWQRYKFHTPYIEGARERALELGYKIEEIWTHEPGLTMKRLIRILYQRGIEGVVVTQPARHLRLDWDQFASVTIGGTLLAPRLHRVMEDINFNLLLALKSLKRLGYQRIGICVMQETDSPTLKTFQATARDIYFSASRAERIPPLFHAKLTDYEMIRKKDSERKKKEAEMERWLKRYKPDVIVGHDNRIKEWVEAAGYRVPEDIGIVLLAVDDDVLDWAGIHSRRRETGAIATDQLVSLMRNRRFGVPKVPMSILIQGSWQLGKTLGSPCSNRKAGSPRPRGRQV